MRPLYLKTFCLLWLTGIGNEEVLCCRAYTKEEASIYFDLNGETYKKVEQGAWCVAELFDF